MKKEFNQLQTTKLGTAAENMLIREFAQSKGYMPFGPLVDGPHAIDSLMMSGCSLWGMDVKCKSSLYYYPETGIDAADYWKYINYPFPVYLLFADIKDNQRKVYGQWIKKLSIDPGTKPYAGKTEKQDGCMYFQLSAMTEYRALTDFEYQSLKVLENSKYPS